MPTVVTLAIPEDPSSYSYSSGVGTGFLPGGVRSPSLPQPVWVKISFRNKPGSWPYSVPFDPNNLGYYAFQSEGHLDNVLEYFSNPTYGMFNTPPFYIFPLRSPDVVDSVRKFLSDISNSPQFLATITAEFRQSTISKADSDAGKNPWGIVPSDPCDITLQKRAKPTRWEDVVAIARGSPHLRKCLWESVNKQMSALPDTEAKFVLSMLPFELQAAVLWILNKKRSEFMNNGMTG